MSVDIRAFHAARPCPRANAVFKSIPLCVAVLASLGSSRSASAAELQQPRLLNTPGLVATPPTDPRCPPPAMFGPRRPARLIVRDAKRPDVGPYTVQLPGYSTGKENLYQPFLIKANPGDTLRIDLKNELGTVSDGSNLINLHTHGLIVLPRRCAPFGDSVYIETAPSLTSQYAITIPAKLPGSMFAGGGPDQPYPSGLNWFHAHVHGQARPDVMAGQSGMLQVGDLLDTLRATPGLTAAAKTALDRTDVLYLGLRDIQLIVKAGDTPDQNLPIGTPAQLPDDNAYDSGACPTQSNPPPTTPPTNPSFAKPGFCAHHGVLSGNVVDLSKDLVWLFTVNGQTFPTISAKVGRNQLWRIANLSANVTYLIELTKDDDSTNKPQPMTVLSLDGIVAGTSPTNGSDMKVGVVLKELLLMPASRAEVFMPAPTPGSAPMTLITAGITTGPPPADNTKPPNGDPWPKISLAHILAPPSPPLVAERRALGPAAAPLLSAFPEIVLPGAASRRGAFSVSATTAAREEKPTNCITLPPGQAVRRRITFSNPSDFELESEVVTPDGNPIDAEHTIGPQAFPPTAMNAPQSVPHVCPRFGEQEVWELVNDTSELHNFHIHQSKFRLSVASDPGVPQAPLAPQDPNGIIAEYVPETQGATSQADVDVWHDTIPVPPALIDSSGNVLIDSSGNVAKPGRVFVTIPFHAREQIGFFVFHCHILEHEDGGMMAVVQVFDPAHPNSEPDFMPAGMMTMPH
jgi:FtsP/CotA-like multicopper oxidase with cupredoxin domain